MEKQTVARSGFFPIEALRPAWRNRPTLNSIRQTDVDTLMIRTQTRVRVGVRLIYLNQTDIGHQILGGVDKV